MNIGAVQAFPLLDGAMTFSPSLAYPDVDPADWAEIPRFLNADGDIDLPTGGFLLRGRDGRLILFDVGSGPGGELPREFAARATMTRKGHLLDALREHGVAPENVTDIVYSRLHADHVGWASVKGVPTFPNARHYVHELDWQFFVEGDADEYTRSCLQPVAGAVQRWNSEDLEITPWLRLIHVPGHTPGSVIGLVESCSETAALIGDLLHSPVEIERPWLRGGADLDQAGTVAQRTEWLARLRDKGATILSPHFPNLAPVKL